MMTIKDVTVKKLNHRTLPLSLSLFTLLLVLGSCGSDKKKNVQDAIQEDVQAKKLLQGIWLNEDEGSVVFKVHGDTIYYPDSTSIPVYFKIVQDSLILQGNAITQYAIVKQAPHLFIFKNPYGDVVRLVKSDNPGDRYAFMSKQPVALNQNSLIKRDTVVHVGDERYHLYVQVNPTTYKIIKNTYTDEGVEVGNIYYDNIIHVSVFNGANRIFSRDFKKQDFKTLIPSDYYNQCILSDFLFDKITADGVTYRAYLPIPDSTTSYVIKVLISFTGKFELSI